MEKAVVSYAEGVLKSTVGKLGTFLWNEALLWGSVRQDIQFIRDELQSMDGFLQDLISSKHLNNQMRVWMLHVLELGCDSELCIDDFKDILDDRRRRGKIRQFVRIIVTLWPRYKIAKMIQELKNRAKEVSERRLRYTATIQPNEEPSTSSQRDERITNDERNDVLVGIDHLAILEKLDPIYMYTNASVDSMTTQPQETTSDHESASEIRSSVPESMHKCNVLAIVGPAGSGKTALAKMLYRRRNVLQYSFSCAAWVTLSREPDLHQIIKAILKQIRKDSHVQADADADNPIKILKEELSKQSRFLIILDSLWSVYDWREIESVFADRDLDHGIIVVTTRSEDLAKACCANREELIHHLKPLTEEQHKTLVGNLISLHADSDFLRSEEKPALYYCCSVPLAVKSLCGVLAGAGMDIRTVNQVAMDLLDNIFDQNLTKDEKVLQVVQLCYSYIPPQLKQCCQDLSIFPEGYAISRKRLVRQWIAKSLAISSGALNEEEVAEGYINELTSRCVIQPESVHACGKVKFYTINGVFKETSMNQGYDQQLSNAGLKCQWYDNHLSSSIENIRETLSSKGSTSLTVLDLEGCRGLRNHDLDNLPIFIQLKFLSLRNTNVSRLPKNIDKLNLLETLDIRKTRVDKVPKGIIKLEHLKYFLAGHSHKPEHDTFQGDLNLLPKAVQVPKGIKRLIKLQTLAFVNATRASKLLHVVRDMNKLKKLGVVIDEKEVNSKPLCISIMMLSGSLRSLSVHDERQNQDRGTLEFLEYLCFPPQLLESLNLKGLLTRLPQWIVDHKQLSKLTLHETKLSSDALRSLGKVQNLRCLKLYTNSLSEHVLAFSVGGFLNLQVLVVHCNVIKTIDYQEGAVPKLETFKWVLSKNQLGKLNGIENLPMLKEMSLIGNVSQIISDEVSIASKKHHDNYSKELILEKIDQEIREHHYTVQKENKGFTAKLKALPKKAQVLFQARCSKAS